MPEYYKITVRGHLDQSWSEWFAGMKVIHLEGNETLLCGPLADQAALHGLIDRIRDLNVTLLSVTCHSEAAPVSNLNQKEPRNEGRT